MKLLKTKAEIQESLGKERRAGHTIGVVPTMGALHDGHLTLVRAMRERCDTLVVWIFVNPTQFNDPKDYEHYPRDLNADIGLLETQEVDYVFAPSEQEMYPSGLEAYYSGGSSRIVAGSASRGMEGACRPGHFDGVAHICGIMFSLMRPDFAVFGEKDFQQVAVVRQMVADLHLGVEIVSVPIARERSGLASSSRNVFLKVEDNADAIYQAMLVAKKKLDFGEKSAEALKKEMLSGLSQAGLAVEYVEIVDPETLISVQNVTSGTRALVAARTKSGVRLIDNMRF